MHAWICTCAHTPSCKRIHTDINAYTYTPKPHIHHTHENTLHRHTDTHMPTYLHPHLLKHAHICTQCTHIYMCMYAYTCTHMCNPSQFTNSHKHTCTHMHSHECLHTYLLIYVYIKNSVNWKWEKTNDICLLSFSLSLFSLIWCPVTSISH